MKATLIKIALLGSVAAIAGCEGTDSYSSFTREAGALVGGGDFGNATMNNTMILSGEKTYVTNLANRFAEEVPSTINFEFNSARIDPDAAAILRRQADWIRQFPEVRFRVYGHTDAVGSNQYNYRLGKRRADAVVRFLSQHGISRSRLEAVVSQGETQPLVMTEARERRNRRTVTEVTGFVRRHPSVLDGKYAQIVYRDYVESAVVATTLTGIEGSVTGASSD
ncbi:OmpA family protein [Thalassovita aquimarina]|uniref:OmpA family protein n=1 Tax=Thalassovita aquimarina TaxID=2785917 RepID=A0ABS5HVR3_9RHOB|nr:OmpA family protein [Thalassovita aquimarina]MBR9653026.1 OmpA family protein [Thalassovita aquimarina]